MRQRFKEMRKALHLSQKKFADSVGISLSYVNFIEMGYNNPSDKIIDKICRIHGISKRWLSTGAGNMIEDGDKNVNVPEPSTVSAPKPSRINDQPLSTVCKNESINNADVRERMKILRKKLGLSQAEMDNKLRIPIGYVSLIETGRKQLKEDEISNICDIFNVKIDWLIEGTGEMFGLEGPTIPANDRGAIEAGKKLKELRERGGLTQKEFAKLVGLNYWHIVLAEQGTRLLNDEQTKKICDAFDVKEELFGKRNLVKEISQIGEKDEAFNANYDLIPLGLSKKLHLEELADLVDLLYQRYEDGKEFAMQEKKTPPKRRMIKVGKQYGTIFVDKEYPKGENGKNYKHYDCHCVKCGKIFQISGCNISTMEENGCSECNRKQRKMDLYQSYLKYIGEEFGNIKVVGLVGTKKYMDNFQFFVKGKCLLCGEEAEYPLNRLKKQPPLSCDKCAKNKWLQKGKETNKKICVDGTSIASIMGRTNGTVNKNSTSGVNGVCRTKSGKWRAYIVLKGKQHHLGNFSELDDAIAARKRAEKKLYDPEIAKFIEENPETWNKVFEAEGTQKDNTKEP